jgi:hypothetical protein
MPSSVGDISAALAYQVKKEIAENYFGTRKALEEEGEDLRRQGKKLEEVWNRTVRPEVSRICRFLVGETEGRAFLELIQRGDLQTSVQRELKTLEGGSSLEGCAVPFALTAKGKYKKLIYSLYRLARINGDELWKEFRSWEKRVGLYNEDLAKFTTSYNLSDILSLIHSLENREEWKGVLGENTDPRTVPLLEEKLILRPIDPGQEEAALLRPLPPFKEVQKPLDLLIDLAFQAHCSDIKKCFWKPKTD